MLKKLSQAFREIKCHIGYMIKFITAKMTLSIHGYLYKIPKPVREKSIYLTFWWPVCCNAATSLLPVIAPFGCVEYLLSLLLTVVPSTRMYIY